MQIHQRAEELCNPSFAPRIKSAWPWKGTSTQLCCAICGDKTTSVCMECSDKDGVVPLCKRVHTYDEKVVHKQCVKRHWDAPENTRRSYSRSQGKKPRLSPVVVQGYCADSD